MERGEVDARGGMVAGSVLMEDVQVQGKAHCVLLATSSAPTLHDQCSLLSTVCKRRGCGAVWGLQSTLDGLSYMWHRAPSPVPLLQ